MSLTLLRTPFVSLHAVAASLGALLLAACPGDDTSQDTEATEGTEATTGGPTTTDGPDPDTTTSPTTTTTTDVTTTGSTTEVLDDTGTTTGEPGGICEGLTVVGNVASVLSRDGMPIDTTCSPAPAPCGGDVVGTWMLEELCGFEAFPNPFEDMCPGSTFMVEVLSQSGTLTFVDDGTLMQDFDIQVQIVTSLDTMACFGVACDAFEAIAQMDNPATTCQAMGPTCTCTIPDDGMPEVAMGTYEVMGDTVVFTIDGESSASDFCIAGDRLDTWQPLFDVPVLTRVACMDEQDCADALGDMYDAYLCEPEG